MNTLRTRWQREQFDPGWLGLLVNPFYHARRGLVRGLDEFLPELRGDVLDLGCGRRPYRDRVPATHFVGVDVDTPLTRALAAADIFYDGRTLPLADASFDGVLCSQVLEHVFTPEAFLREAGRVLRPGGRLVLTVPFVWDEHEQPQDYARYSSFGLRALLERTGYEVVAQRKSVADVRALVQLASGWLYKRTRTRHRGLNLLAQLGLIAPVNLLGVVLGAILPGNEDFYLDNIVLARKHADRP
jgi:SAM-dependent methyltransferase